MVDVFLTHEGDFLLDTSDVHIVTDMEEALQCVARRVKTQTDGPLGGKCALDRLVGRLLTAEALRDGEALIRMALTGAHALLNFTITVRGIPVTSDAAIFLISLLGPDGETERLFTIPFDFQYGVTERRTDTTIGTFPLSA